MSERLMEMYEDMKEKDARIAALRARVAELESALKMLVAHGEAGLDDESDLEFARYRCTVCGRVGAVGRCCGDETRERISA